MFWLVFYYSVNQISCLTTQSKHLQHAPWTRTWTWTTHPWSLLMYPPPNSSFPACSSVCCVSWRLRLAVIFTVKSICSRQKQHLILLWVAALPLLQTLAISFGPLTPTQPPYHPLVSVIWPLWVLPSKVLHKNKQPTHDEPEKLAMKQRYKFMVISTTETHRYTIHMHPHTRPEIRFTHRHAQLQLVCFTVNNAYICMSWGRP